MTRSDPPRPRRRGRPSTASFAAVALATLLLLALPTSSLAAQNFRGAVPAGRRLDPAKIEDGGRGGRILPGAAEGGRRLAAAEESATDVEATADAQTGAAGAASETNVEDAEKKLIEEAKKEEQKKEAASPATSTGGFQGSGAWKAHGSVGAVVFGLLVPAAISSALFRECIPSCWIYLHVSINLVTFVLTLFTAGIAFVTMNGMGQAGEGHLKEMHHIAGLILLLLVSFQTANGFLRPPREMELEDEHDRFTARAIWHLVHGIAGLCIFAMGAYQVRSGLGLYSLRFGTPDWGQVWVGYIGWLTTLLGIAKAWMYCSQRRARVDPGARKGPKMEIIKKRGSSYDERTASGK